MDRVMFIIQRASKKQQMTINPFLSSWRIALNELNTMEDETKIRIKFRCNNKGKTQIHLLYVTSIELNIKCSPTVHIKQTQTTKVERFTFQRGG